MWDKSYSHVCTVMGINQLRFGLCRCYISLQVLILADVAVRLMPMVIHAAIVKLLNQGIELFLNLFTFTLYLQIIMMWIFKYCIFLYSEESSIPVIEKQISAIITKSTRVMRAPRADVRKFEVRISTL